MAYEINVDGQVHVFTFTVVYEPWTGDEERVSMDFTDYTDGWDWARRCVSDYELSLSDEAVADGWGITDVEVDDRWEDRTDEVDEGE